MKIYLKRELFCFNHFFQSPPCEGQTSKISFCIALMVSYLGALKIQLLFFQVVRCYFFVMTFLSFLIWRHLCVNNDFSISFYIEKWPFFKKYLVLSSLNNKNVKILSHLPKAAISSLSYALQTHTHTHTHRILVDFLCFACSQLSKLSQYDAPFIQGS